MAPFPLHQLRSADRQRRLIGQRVQQSDMVGIKRARLGSIYLQHALDPAGPGDRQRRNRPHFAVLEPGKRVVCGARCVINKQQSPFFHHATGE